ncbi:MAG: ester cyclase [Solirubrobacteraceae bacterium]
MLLEALREPVLLIHVSHPSFAACLTGRPTRRRGCDNSMTTASVEAPVPTIQKTDNRAAFERFCDAMNTRDAAVISTTIDELVEPDALIRTPLPLDSTGRDKLKEVFARLHRAFPDLHVTVEDLIAEGDKVVARNTVTGTHQGEYMGLPATGKAVTYDEIFIFRFVDGRVAETWGVVDVFSQMRQLGMTPQSRS